MKKLVICGDSFNIGIGCTQLDTEPYGCLLANSLNMKLRNLAKGSSSNYSIYLQGKHAVEVEPDLVILSVTSYDRTEWVKEDAEEQFNYRVQDVNYHLYPPYLNDGGYHNNGMDHPFKDDPTYTGKILTEQYAGIFDYAENFQGKDLYSKKSKYRPPNGKHLYYERLMDEPPEKIEVMKQYFLDVFDHNIKKDYDLGLFCKIHHMLNKKNIKHLILVPNGELDDAVPAENLIDLNWFALAQTYPDTIGSLHTSAEGHVFAHDKIVKKLQENNWI